MAPERTIIVGYDGRPAADDAVVLAAEFARPVRASLMLVFVHDTETAASAYGILRRGLAPLPYGFPARVRAIQDTPAWSVLADLAEEMEAVLIVIGSDAGGRRLLECAPCAVAVAPKDFRRQGAEARLAASAVA